MTTDLTTWQINQRYLNYALLIVHALLLILLWMNLGDNYVHDAKILFLTYGLTVLLALWNALRIRDYPAQRIPLLMAHVAATIFTLRLFIPTSLWDDAAGIAVVSIGLHTLFIILDEARGRAVKKAHRRVDKLKPESLDKRRYDERPYHVLSADGELFDLTEEELALIEAHRATHRAAHFRESGGFQE